MATRASKVRAKRVTVGAGVGAVGAFVGAAVGAAVGADVGAADGAAVGAFVGAAVGALVGLAVGAVVGAAVVGAGRGRGRGRGGESVGGPRDATEWKVGGVLGGIRRNGDLGFGSGFRFGFGFVLGVQVRGDPRVQLFDVVARRVDGHCPVVVVHSSPWRQAG